MKSTLDPKRAVAKSPEATLANKKSDTGEIPAQMQRARQDSATALPDTAQAMAAIMPPDAAKMSANIESRPSPGEDRMPMGGLRLRTGVVGDDLNETLAAARVHFAAEAVGLAERLIVAIDQRSGLIAMNLENHDGVLAAKDSQNSALDAARTTRGLAELGLSLADASPAEAKKLLDAAQKNWEATRKHLRTEDGLPIHLQTFDPATTHVGENNTDRRVNADGLYPASDSAALVMLANKLGLDSSKYRQALKGETARVLRDFYDPRAEAFVYHVDANTSSPEEKDDKGNNVVFTYPNGVVGNDGAVYALAALLIPTLKALGRDANTIDTKGKVGGAQFAEIVKGQLDLISERFTFMNGAMWETYAVKDNGSLDPIRFSWQDQEVKPPVTLADGSTLTRSHVAIGGHTAMAAGQLAEGARELCKLGVITGDELAHYLDRSVEILQGALDHGVIDWRTGLVQNANMLEVPDGYPDQRRKPGGNDWGQAGWQQRELIQTLLVLRDVGRLDDLNLPNAMNGRQLLKESLALTERDFGVPQNYTGGFGDEWRYHALQTAAYLQHSATGQDSRGDRNLA